MLFVVPAVALTWVGWRTEGGGSYTVAMLGSAGALAPHAYLSPWMPVAVAQAVVVVLMWALVVLGLTARRAPRTPRVAPRSGRTA